MVPCKSTAEEASFDWSHHLWDFSTDSKVRTTIHVSKIDSGSERVAAKVKSAILRFPRCDFVRTFIQ